MTNRVCQEPNEVIVRRLLGIAAAVPSLAFHCSNSASLFLIKPAVLSQFFCLLAMAGLPAIQP